MTLREQIKQIHAKYFDEGFHEFRGELYPAMVQDLKGKFFEMLEFSSVNGWTLPESKVPAREIAAVKHADKLIQRCGFRDNTPALNV